MSKKLVLTEEAILSRIFLIRGQKVMLDTDLALLYRVLTRNLNKAVGRNLKRFPADFMFQLSKKEYQNLMFQIGTSSWGGTRKMPYAFTENGVAMLSSILNSNRAILANIHIIRVFTRMRNTIMTNKDILLKLGQMEKQTLKHGGDIKPTSWCQEPPWSFGEQFYRKYLILMIVSIFEELQKNPS